MKGEGSTVALRRVRRVACDAVRCGLEARAEGQGGGEEDEKTEGIPVEVFVACGTAAVAGWRTVDRIGDLVTLTAVTAVTR